MTIPSSSHYSMRETLLLSMASDSVQEQNEGAASHKFQPTRRAMLSKAVGVAAAATTGLVAVIPEASHAAQPVNARDTDSVLAMAKRRLRPKPPKVLRRKLAQDFAVLLMRSSYNALDALDCVAMDQFQRDFFLIRLGDYETYKNYLGPGMVQQGDLTDPYYFDFISLAQYKTINREVTQDPPYVFEEQQLLPQDESNSISSQALKSANDNANTNSDTASPQQQRFASVVVQRNPDTLPNSMLIPTHEAMVGASILDKLQETFGATDVKIPPPEHRPDAMILLKALRSIVNLFLINGYAFQGEVIIASNSNSGASNGDLATFKVSLSAPATLWSGKVLQSEGDPLDNNFVSKTLQEYIRRCGYETTKSVVKYEGANEELTLVVR